MRGLAPSVGVPGPRGRLTLLRMAGSGGLTSPAQRRQVMLSEYGEWLRTQTNRHGRPFQPETILAYRDAAVALSSWMTSAGLEADFTGRYRTQGSKGVVHGCARESAG